MLIFILLCCNIYRTIILWIIINVFTPILERQRLYKQYQRIDYNIKTTSIELSRTLIILFRGAYVLYWNIIIHNVLNNELLWTEKCQNNRLCLSVIFSLVHEGLWLNDYGTGANLVPSHTYNTILWFTSQNNNNVQVLHCIIAAYLIHHDRFPRNVHLTAFGIGRPRSIITAGLSAA